MDLQSSAPLARFRSSGLSHGGGGSSRGSRGSGGLEPLGCSGSLKSACPSEAHGVELYLRPRRPTAAAWSGGRDGAEASAAAMLPGRREEEKGEQTEERERRSIIFGLVAWGVVCFFPERSACYRRDARTRAPDGDQCRSSSLWPVPSGGASKPQ